MVQVRAGDVAMAALPWGSGADRSCCGDANWMHHHQKDGGGKTGGGGKSSSRHDHADKVEGRYLHHERLGGGDSDGNG